MEDELHCNECDHLKEEHLAKDGSPNADGCSECGCDCHEDNDFVTHQRYRVYNETFYQARDEQSALDMFADDSVDFAAGADIEELAEDDGEITCHYYEWHRVETRDIQEKAKDRLGRSLTKKELEHVSDVFIHSWDAVDVIGAAIDVALQDRK